MQILVCLLLSSYCIHDVELVPVHAWVGLMLLKVAGFSKEKAEQSLQTKDLINLPQTFPSFLSRFSDQKVVALIPPVCFQKWNRRKWNITNRLFPQQLLWSCPWSRHITPPPACLYWKLAGTNVCVFVWMFFFSPPSDKQTEEASLKHRLVENIRVNTKIFCADLLRDNNLQKNT